MKKRPKKKGWLRLFFVLSIVSMLLVGVFVWTKKPKITIPHDVPSEEAKQERYDYLISHKSAVPVKEGFYPVLIFENPKFTDTGAKVFWSSSGTALVKDGAPKLVISAAHCFTDDAAYYIYIVTPNLDHLIWSIESVKQQFSGKNNVDVAIAVVGTAVKEGQDTEDAKPLKGIWSGNNSPIYGGKMLWGALPAKYYVRSLITGEQYPVIGVEELSGDPVRYYVMDYSPTRAESGSGFISDDGHFLILNMAIGLDEKIQRGMGIEPRSGYFALLTDVSIKSQ